MEYYYSDEQKEKNLKLKRCQINSLVDDKQILEKKDNEDLLATQQIEKDFVLTPIGWKEYSGIVYSNGAGYHKKPGEKPFLTVERNGGFNDEYHHAPHLHFSSDGKNKERVLDVSESGKCYRKNVTAKEAEVFANLYNKGITADEIRMIGQLLQGFQERGLPAELLTKAIISEDKRTRQSKQIQKNDGIDDK